MDILHNKSMQGLCPQHLNKIVFMGVPIKSQQGLQFKHDLSHARVHKKKQNRKSMILPENVGAIFSIHNGKTFISVHVSQKMIGHKFGEFASTRKKPLHKKKKK